ncbi:MAG: hypothetical protein A3F91_12375 [Flavobacteria bacterium RIFCSPLOWO2_12_FULL_35_11]|nr:MAG: hypothetical protein A3F91_12375 [Flavobacteria bacterium RIFCSPLOWO2_12_FULL_35_11]
MKIEYIEKDEFYACLKENRLHPDITKWEKNFLGDMRVAVLYGCKLLVVKDKAGKIMSILNYTVTKGYLNIYFQYTIPEGRGKKLASKLIDKAIEDNFREVFRIYVIASSVQAAAFYYAKAFTFYGLDSKGCFLCELEIVRTDDKIKSEKKIVVGIENDTDLRKELRRGIFNLTEQQLKEYKFI